MLKKKCVYAYIFETPVPEDSNIMRKYRYCPHPFIIEPPENTKTVFKSEEELAFGLVLIGKAIDYLPYFIYTFEELGEIGIGKGRGKFELVEVKNGEKVIYSSDTKALKPFVSSALNFESISADSGLLTVDFKTPTRIVYDTQLTLDLEFHILMRALLRRISLLSYFHCNKDMPDIDFKGIIEKAGKVKTSQRSLEWHDWERYSARQDTRMKLGGFKGEIKFEGDISDFMPLIMLGEHVHVGKGTSFGLGKYEIIN
ncbi:MAG: CRISPR system precrRNA processing endoribonuclease RAMP protein Cas6 [bacterium]